MYMVPTQCNNIERLTPSQANIHKRVMLIMVHQCKAEKNKDPTPSRS
jgi:hypothetical protein